jgi:hypothetical protein
VLKAAAQGLEALLAEQGVKFAPNSWIGEAIANATVRLPQEILLDRNPEMDADALLRRIQRLREAADLLLLWNAVKSARAVLSPPSFGKSLRLLAKGAHGLSAATDRSRQRDLAFELMVAGWIGTFARDIALDEPDVTSEYQGEVWGIACKTASAGPSSLRDSVKRGIAQIEKSEVDCGLLMVRLTDIYPHERLHLPLPPDRRVIRAYVNKDAAMEVAHGVFAELVEEIVRDLRFGETGSSLQWTPRLKSIAFVGHTLVHALEGDEPFPGIALLHHGVIPRVPPPEFAKEIHHSMGLQANQGRMFSP